MKTVQCTCVLTTVEQVIFVWVYNMDLLITSIKTSACLCYFNQRNWQCIDVHANAGNALGKIYSFCHFQTQRCHISVLLILQAMVRYVSITNWVIWINHFSNKFPNWIYNSYPHYNNILCYVQFYNASQHYLSLSNIPYLSILSLSDKYTIIFIVSIATIQQAIIIFFEKIEPTWNCCVCVCGACRPQPRIWTRTASAHFVLRLFYKSKISVIADESASRLLSHTPISARLSCARRK